MAPAFSQTSPVELVGHITRSIASTLLVSRSTDAPKSALASVFALVITHALNNANSGLSSRAITMSMVPRSTDADIYPFDSNSNLDLLHSDLSKRQNYILVIPATYAGLNAGPAPGAVVGITLGAIGGFIIVLYLVLTLYKLTYGGVVSEEIITTKHKHRSRSRSHSDAPRRERRETVVVEERVTRESRASPVDEVVVEEEEDDIVEVIEEHSPERRPSRRESKRTSGFRTVDPTQPGGGNAPMRKLSRRQ